MLRTLFAAASFVSAALLFLVQPMLARFVLPLFGGGPAVWTTCMVFFQAALLAGYLYAHLLTTRLSSRWQAALHLVLMVAAAAVLPISVSADRAPPPESNPVPWLLAAVAMAVGLPFFALSASAPLLQRWYAATAGPAGADPYRLYAASNAGSFLGLIAYPLLVEPRLGLGSQGVAWAVGYGVLVALFVACGWRVWGQSGAAMAAAGEVEQPAPSWKQRIGWVALALAPSSLMLGITAALSTDVPPVPMLWVAPLSIYLLTFVIAFGRGAKRLRWSVWGVPAAVAVEAVILSRPPESAPPLLALIAIHLGAFALVAMGCHAELAATRPPTARLTEYYLCLSVGGVFGGLLNAVVAPAVFNSIAEFPLALAGAAVVVPLVRAANREWTGKWLLPAGALAAAGVLFVMVISGPDHVLYQERSFFGVSRVVQGRRENTHQLLHGTVEHGGQVLDKGSTRHIAPFLYYHPDGPIGQVFQSRAKTLDNSPVGVVGLGCGSLAYYWVKDQPFVFFEIDPTVIRIARNPELFTFVRDSKAKCEIVPGDARLSLQKQPDGRFGLLVIDAFSGDSIPVHLMTAEAVELYRRKLAPGGTIAFHISNNYFELEPVLAAIAARDGLVGLSRRDRRADLTEADHTRGRLPCHWLLLSPTTEGLKWVDGDPRWKPLRAKPNDRVWTDDYANVLGALRSPE